MEFLGMGVMATATVVSFLTYHILPILALNIIRFVCNRAAFVRVVLVTVLLALPPMVMLTIRNRSSLSVSLLYAIVGAARARQLEDRMLRDVERGTTYWMVHGTAIGALLAFAFFETGCWVRYGVNPSCDTAARGYQTWDGPSTWRARRNRRALDALGSAVQGAQGAKDHQRVAGLAGWLCSGWCPCERWEPINGAPNPGRLDLVLHTKPLVSRSRNLASLRSSHPLLAPLAPAPPPRCSISSERTSPHGQQSQRVPTIPNKPSVSTHLAACGLGLSSADSPGPWTGTGLKTVAKEAEWTGREGKDTAAWGLNLADSKDTVFSFYTTVHKAAEIRHLLRCAQRSRAHRPLSRACRCELAVMRLPNGMSPAHRLVHVICPKSDPTGHCPIPPTVIAWTSFTESLNRDILTIALLIYQHAVYRIMRFRCRLLRIFVLRKGLPAILCYAQSTSWYRLISNT
ncbi:hypothetical protein PSPO01_13921 [Paraphaeosphaeria sporulosa]